MTLSDLAAIGEAVGGFVGVIIAIAATWTDIFPHLRPDEGTTHA